MGVWCDPHGRINRAAWRGTGIRSVGTLGASGVVAAAPNRWQGQPSHRLPKVGSWWQGRKRRRSGVPWVGGGELIEV